jgi:hemoglobin
MRKGMIFTSVLAAFALAGAACGGKSGGSTTPAATGERPLYDRIGGKDAIISVVDEFIGHVAADARINAFFVSADVPRLKTMLVDQICEATGGPCKYTGKSMRESHAGMGVKEADFNALVEDLVKALDSHKVPEKEKTELLTALGAMKGDIVDVPAGAAAPAQ